MLLAMLTLQGGCQSKPDNTFEVPIYVIKIVFPDGSEQTTALSGTTWSTLTGKPATFAPSAHTHPYTDVTGTPQIDLQAAIGQMKYIELPQATTTEINALVIPAGKIVEIWDKTLKCKKVWDGAMWKVYITNQ